MKSVNRFLRVATVLAMWAVPAFAQSNDLDQAANDLLAAGYPTPAASQRLKDELLLESAVQTYLWALPALNMYGMKEGSEKVFGKGYNVLPIWKERLNAKTLITTPNSDVIYAMGYLDLKEDGPIVIEARRVSKAFWTISGSDRSAPKARSKAACGVVMLVFPARTTEEAASICCFHPTSRARHRMDTTLCVRALMACLSSGAVFLRRSAVVEPISQRQSRLRRFHIRSD